MININYVTTNQFKIEENKVFQECCKLLNGSIVSEKFNFSLHNINIPERLEIDLVEMVRCEAKEAYRILKIPCVVEHAGLIFEKYKNLNYPGGLTKPMWNTFNDSFLTASIISMASSRVILAGSL